MLKYLLSLTLSISLILNLHAEEPNTKLDQYLNALAQYDKASGGLVIAQDALKYNTQKGCRVRHRHRNSHISGGRDRLHASIPIFIVASRQITRLRVIDTIEC